MAKKKDNYLYYNGERLDLTEWVTPAVKALDYPDKTESYVRKLIWNRKHKPQRAGIDHKDIPELGLTLVKK